MRVFVQGQSRPSRTRSEAPCRQRRGAIGWSHRSVTRARAHSHRSRSKPRHVTRFPFHLPRCIPGFSSGPISRHRTTAATSGSEADVLAWTAWVAITKPARVEKQRGGRAETPSHAVPDHPVDALRCRRRSATATTAAEDQVPARAPVPAAPHPARAGRRQDQSRTHQPGATVAAQLSEPGGIRAAEDDSADHPAGCSARHDDQNSEWERARGVHGDSLRGGTHWTPAVQGEAHFWGPQ